jgi:hypothetical protein
MPLLDPFETEVTPAVIELFKKQEFTARIRKE